ncbi:FAD/NAD(P)-binding domain-containing protein [Aspergillus pseudodeflectus]|uniref:FAD/NAD(P)-binding domain-containing protein n=1 Tax=Aspergillus pseudodeflectus TaxID=176178 RepID=A0ABR4JE09_9EURO
MTKAKGTGPSGTAPPGSSGITVIVVGLGIGGLSAVIECQRKGHHVIGIEQQSSLKPIGDSIGLASNAATVVKKWGDGSVDAALAPLLNLPDTMDICDSAGKLLVRSRMAGYGEGHGYPCHRGELAMVLYEHARTLECVEFRLGHRILDYWEDNTRAGVIMDGERLAADCVIAADGVHSQARRFVSGDDGRPHSSGYAMYRAWFDAEAVATDPETRWVVDNTETAERDNTWVFIGEDIHLMLGTAKAGKEVFWMCTHKDVYDIGESWSFPGKVEDALKIIENWPIAQTLRPVLIKTPANRLIDFKLLWRDPLDTWISKSGRIMVIGDAAHPYLPTSGQGAGQAIEDAATVAITLELSGRRDVKAGLKVAEKLRYQRACKIQQMGIETRDSWHKADWDQLEQNAAIIEMPRPHWIFGHDCQEYAYAEFEKAMHSVRTGVEYQPSNIAPEGEDHQKVDFQAHVAATGVAA